MAEMAMYHSLGDDQNNPNGQPAPPNQQYRPPVAPPPSGYQQSGTPIYGQQPPTPYGQPPQLQPSPYPQQGAYGAPPPQPSTSPYPQQGPFGPPPQQPYGGGDVGGLAQGMAGMDLGGVGSQPGTISRASKKKQRAHAYHQLDQAPDASSGSNLPAFNPNVANQVSQGFLGGNSPTPGAPSPPGGSSQFPLPAASAFAPGAATDPAAFAARPGSSTGVTHTGGRIDPNTIPSIPYLRDASAAHYRTTVFPTLARHLPPNASSDFIAHDQGNASPRICRLTLNAVPASADLLASTSLPLALTIQPLAKLKPEEESIPVLDFGEMGPPRCRRCRTYINPFMQFLQGGNKFRCNMCLFPNNEVTGEYYAPVDMSGIRVDREQRPELMRGTVEFVVPKEYWAKKDGAESTTEGRGGAPMRWLFLVDVTEGSVNRGSLEAVVGGIREALYGETAYELTREGEESEDGMEGKKRRLPKGCRVGICTFDKDIHFYNLNPALDQAQMMVMSDLEEPFVPLSEGLFVDPYESRPVIEALLDSLPSMFVHIKNAEPALFPALNASLSALQQTGGKIICSMGTLPTWGPNRLHLRDDSKVYNTDKERLLFRTDNAQWRTLAGKMVEAGVGVDFFLTPSAYIDVATVGHVASTTGGETYLYANFVKDRDSARLHKEISHAFHRETGYQALMKVRCSNGLQVSAYHGNFLQTGSSASDVEFGVIDEDKAMAIMFSYDGKLDSKVDAHFQSALLYTTKTGERRVRCSNVVAAVTDQGREAVRWVDQDAVLGVLAREAASRMIEKPLKEIRGALTEKCIEILAAYRKNISSSGNPPGQLVLPESLKEFAMYVLSLLKTRAFRGGNVSSDMRTHSARLLKSLPPLDLQMYLYPRVIALHTLSDQDGFPGPDGHLQIPAAIRASFGFIEEGGAYVVDNGQFLLLWIHAHVSPNLLIDLFGPEHETLQSLNPMMNELPVLETQLNAQARNIIQYLSSLRGARKVAVQLARQGLDGAEYEFAGALVEDRNNEEKSYVDWLVHVHKYIQLEVTGQRKKDDGIGAGLDPASGMAGLRPPYW